MNALYAVVEHNRSGQPDEEVTFHDDLNDAREMVAALTAESQHFGWRETYRIYELIEVDDE